jgi:hypothetical protein
MEYDEINITYSISAHQISEAKTHTRNFWRCMFLCCEDPEKPASVRIDVIRKISA